MSMGKHVGWILALPVALLLAAGALWSQQMTGTLTGIVTDSEGAVIPGAKVTLVNEASGSTLRTETNGEGYFSIAAIYPGSYTLRVQSEGFAALERTHIVFRPGDKRHLSNLQMQIGAVTETVTVSAASETITPVDSGEQSSVVTAEQLQNLSVVGRSAAEFIKILPGMAPVGSGLVNKPGYNGENIGINGNGDGGRQSALGYFSSNGQDGQAMDIVTDGANTADPGCNCATPVNPNVDMVQEFKVLTGTYTAEHAKGPTVMQAVTKSGGKDFHGMAYIYARDYRLNSNDWELNRAGRERPKNKYRFPGGNIGGPVLLPGTSFNRNRDKLFFFAGYEYYMQKIDTGVLQAIVPTEAMRNGDFSDAAYLASLSSADVRKVPVGEGIVAGVIPPSLWEERGRILQSLLPLPNADPKTNNGKNYVNALLLDQNMHQFTTRVDYNISDYTKLFVRYNLQRELQHFPVQLWGRAGASVPYPSEIEGKNRSDSISASLTNVLNPTATNEVIFGYTFIDFPNSLVDPAAVARSNLNYPIEGIYDNGIDQIPDQRNQRGLAIMQNRGGLVPGPYSATKWLISGADNFSLFKGNHSLKMGFYWQQIIQDQPNAGKTQGRFDFRPNHALTTGNAYADQLMGIYQRYFEQNQNHEQYQYYNTYEGYVQDSWKVTPSFTLEMGLRFAHFQPWTDKSKLGAGFGVFDESLYSNDPADRGKLTGLLYHGIDPSIPLSGRHVTGMYFQPRFGFAWDVFGDSKTIVRGGFGVFRYNEPTRYGGALGAPAGTRATNQTQPGYMKDIDDVSPKVARTGINVVDIHDKKHPVSYNWSFEIGRRIRRDMMFRVAYVGNAGRDLLKNGGLRNINRVPEGAMLDNPDGNVNDYRPFSNYGAINRLNHGFWSNYHSLQSTFTKQMGRVNLFAAYTFSKVLGIRGGASGDTADNLHVENNYGVLKYDRTHMFNVAYVLDVPNWHGTNKFIRGVLNNWQISGISTYASGVELAASGRVNFNLSGQLADGSAIKATSITGTDSIKPMPFLVCDPSKNLADGQYVNGDCFAPPSRGHNGVFTFPYLRGPALFSHDLSVFKNFPIGDGSKRIQFRFSAYNFINHPLDSFRNGDTNLHLTFDETGKQTNERFGYVGQKVGRRVVQLGLKFYF